MGIEENASFVVLKRTNITKKLIKKKLQRLKKIITRKTKKRYQHIKKNGIAKEKGNKIMQYNFTIPGSIISLNEYIRLCRTNKFVGANEKKKIETFIFWQIKEQLKDVEISKRVHISYLFVEKNKKRDLDNIASFAMKVIQDSLVNSKVLVNDGWEQIEGFTCNFAINKSNPHINIEIVETNA